MVEYALLLGFVALGSVAILTTLSNSISGFWTAVATRLASTS
jgi:Flp pilus assembly pilin Flp